MRQSWRPRSFENTISKGWKNSKRVLFEQRKKKLRPLASPNFHNFERFSIILLTPYKQTTKASIRYLFSNLKFHWNVINRHSSIQWLFFSVFSPFSSYFSLCQFLFNVDKMMGEVNKEREKRCLQIIKTLFPPEYRCPWHLSIIPCPEQSKNEK